MDGNDNRADGSSEESRLGATKSSRRDVLAGAAGLSGLAFLPEFSGQPTSNRAASQDSEAPINIGSRLELFVDDYLVESADGVEATYHHPEFREVVIDHDEAWEGKYSIYHSVFRDEDHPYDYRMYYRGQGGDNPGRTAYAESDDGVDWEKPNLTEDDTNIVTDFDGVGNPAVFKDDNPDAPADERYKAVGITGGPALSAYTSPDGFDWSPVENNPVITQGAFDSHNTAIWNPVDEEYRAFWRDFDGGRRIILTATSPDFRNWSEPTPLEYPEAPEEQLYTNGIKPYYRAPHIWLGFPARYVERDAGAASMQELPGWDLRQDLLPSRQGYAVTDALLMSSRDGQTFNRAPKSFLPPGLWSDESTANWFYGDNYPSWNVVETPSPTPGKPRELSIYATENYRNGESEKTGDGASRLRRYSLRIDGFVSMEAPLSGGEFVTKPVIFDGTDLMVNYATSAAGAVRVELQTPGGEPYPGFSLSESPELFGDDIERTVEWSGGAKVCELKGRPVRIRFVMADAHVYSFQFQPSTEKPTEPVGEAAAHWPLDEIQSDGTVLDASGNGNDGTNNGATVTSGVVDNAFEFDGSSNVQIPQDSSLNPAEQGAVTIAGWVTIDNAGESEYIFDGDGHTYGLYLNAYNPTFYVATEAGNVLLRQPGAPDSGTVHLAATFDGSEMRLYANAELIGTETVSDPLASGTGYSRIGEYVEDGYGQKGIIDDLHVFDKALSEAQIRTLVQKASEC